MPTRREGQIGDYWLSANRHGVWSRTWFDRSRKHVAKRSLGTRDFDAAVKLLAEWIVLNERLERENPADVPLYAILDRYHEHHGKHTARGGEMSALAVAKLKAFYPAATVVGQLTLEFQREFERSLRDQGLSAGYLARIQSVLKAALNRAYRNQEIASAPYVRIVASHAERERLLTLQEAAALFNAPKLPEHVFIYLLLAFNTLARPEALLELQPFQVDFEQRLMRLNPPGRIQTKKHRPTLPITDTLLPWLQAHAKQTYFVQWTRTQARPIASLKTTWRRLRADAGLDALVVPYTIRHSMATDLRRRGVPEWEVAGFLGHRVAGTTERYAKFAPDYLSRAATAIDDYMHELQPLVKRELILNVTQIRGRKTT